MAAKHEQLTITEPLLVNKWDSNLFQSHYIISISDAKFCTVDYACSLVDNAKYVLVYPSKQCKYMVAEIQHVGAA